MRRLLAHLLLGLLPVALGANPTFVGSATGGVNVGTSISIPYTVGTNTDECLVVVVGEQTSATVSGITWNGHAFTKFGAVAFNTGNYFGSELWYYPAGNTSGQASTVVVSLGAGAVAPAVVGEYKLVNQATPLLNLATASAQNSPLNTNVTVSNNGSLTLDCVAFYSSVSLSNSDFTNRGGVVSSLVVAGLLERGPYSPGTQTANDTFTASPCYSSHVVAELQGDGAGPSPTPTTVPTNTPVPTATPIQTYTPMVTLTPPPRIQPNKPWVALNNYLFTEVNGKAIADWAVTSGLRDKVASLGGELILHDDNQWAQATRIGGHISPTSSYPDLASGAYAAYIHADGLKYGLYGDVGSEFCGGTGPGSGPSYYATDAADYASYGVDDLSADSCFIAPYNPQTQYLLFSNAWYAASQAIGKNTTFEIWGPPDTSVPNYYFQTWETQTGSTSWFTAVGNSDYSWASHLGQWANSNNSGGDAYSSAANGWNEYSTLFVTDAMGTPSIQGLYSLWAIKTTPMMLGDVGPNSNTVCATLFGNTEMLAIALDTTGVGVFITAPGNTGILAKPLATNGTYAVCMANNTGSTINSTATTAMLNAQFGTSLSGTFSVRDALNHVDLGTYSTGYTGTLVTNSANLLVFSYNAPPPNIQQRKHRRRSMTLNLPPRG